MSLEKYHSAIQKAVYKTFDGLNGNQWKVLASFKNKSENRILYVQDMTRNIYISGLFPFDLDNEKFIFQIRATNDFYIFTLNDNKAPDIVKATTAQVSKHFAKINSTKKEYSQC